MILRLVGLILLICIPFVAAYVLLRGVINVVAATLQTLVRALGFLLLGRDLEGGKG
jgi:hypothetical protein